VKGDVRVYVRDEIRNLIGRVVNWWLERNKERA
jgi:hypothetical protein